MKYILAFLLAIHLVCDSYQNLTRPTVSSKSTVSISTVNTIATLICLEDEDCRMFPNTVCKLKKCQCNNVSYDTNGTCNATKEVGSGCLKSLECQSKNCSSLLCVCNEGFYPENKTCMPGVKMGFNKCEKDLQCQTATKSSLCDPVKKVCVCEDKFYLDNLRCVLKKFNHEKCYASVECLSGNCSRRVCTCLVNFYEEGMVCLPGLVLTQECDLSYKCQHGIPFSYCHPYKKRCHCEDWYYEEDKRCQFKKYPKQGCLKSLECVHHTCDKNVCRCPPKYHLGLDNKSCLYGTDGSECKIRYGGLCDTKLLMSDNLDDTCQTLASNKPWIVYHLTSLLNMSYTLSSVQIDFLIDDFNAYAGIAVTPGLYTLRYQRRDMLDQDLNEMPSPAIQLSPYNCTQDGMSHVWEGKSKKQKRVRVRFACQAPFVSKLFVVTLNVRPGSGMQVCEIKASAVMRENILSNNRYQNRIFQTDTDKVLDVISNGIVESTQHCVGSSVMLSSSMRPYEIIIVIIDIMGRYPIFNLTDIIIYSTTLKSDKFHDYRFAIYSSLLNKITPWSFRCLEYVGYLSQSDPLLHFQVSRNYSICIGIVFTIRKSNPRGDVNFCEIELYGHELSYNDDEGIKIVSEKVSVDGINTLTDTKEKLKGNVWDGYDCTQFSTTKAKLVVSSRDNMRNKDYSYWNIHEVILQLGSPSFQDPDRRSLLLNIELVLLFNMGSDEIIQPCGKIKRAADSPLAFYFRCWGYPANEVALELKFDGDRLGNFSICNFVVTGQEREFKATLDPPDQILYLDRNTNDDVLQLIPLYYESTLPTLRLSCVLNPNISNLVRASIITSWLFNGEVIAGPMRGNFVELRISVPGKILCILSLNGVEFRSNEAEVVLIDQPQTELTSRKFSPIDLRGNVSCITVPDLKYYKIRWIETKSKRELSNGNQLMLSSIDSKQQAFYTCIIMKPRVTNYRMAADECQITTQTVSFSVEGEGLEIFPKLKHGLIKVRRGTSFTLTCISSKSLNSSKFNGWYKDGRLYSNQTKLHIAQTTNQNSGTYHCSLLDTKGSEMKASATVYVYSIVMETPKLTVNEYDPISLKCSIAIQPPTEIYYDSVLWYRNGVLFNEGIALKQEIKYAECLYTGHYFCKITARLQSNDATESITLSSVPLFIDVVNCGKAFLIVSIPNLLITFYVSMFLTIGAILGGYRLTRIGIWGNFKETTWKRLEYLNGYFKDKLKWRLPTGKVKPSNQT